MALKKALIFFLLTAFPLLNSSSVLKVQKIIEAVSKMTGQPGPADIRVRILTASEVENAFLSDFMDRHPPAVLQEESRQLTLIGIFKEKVQIEAQLEKMIRGNIKAYYQSESNQLFIDDSISFEDEYSLGPVIAAIRMASTALAIDKEPYRGRFFCDENWFLYAFVHGDASLVRHRFYGEDLAMLSSMDGLSLIGQDPLVSAANGYELEPVIRLFFTQGLIQGVKHAQGVFRKKEWKGLSKRLKDPPANLIDFLVDKPQKGPDQDGNPVLALSNGFSRLSIEPAGLFLFAAFVDKPLVFVLSEMGWCADTCARDRSDAHGGDIVLWKVKWTDVKSARDGFMILRDRYETWLGCRFEDGERMGKTFIAGRDECGAYVFLRHDYHHTLLVRSFNRNTINSFIENAQY